MVPRTSERRLIFLGERERDREAPDRLGEASQAPIQASARIAQIDHGPESFKNDTLAAMNPKQRFSGAYKIGVYSAWGSTVRGSTMLGPPIWDLVALIPAGVHKAGVYSAWGSTVRESTMLGPPIWDVVALTPAGVHKSGVYSVGVYSAGVYPARATDLGLGSLHTCRGPQGGGLQRGGLQCSGY